MDSGSGIVVACVLASLVVGVIFRQWFKNIAQYVVLPALRILWSTMLAKVAAIILLALAMAIAVDRLTDVKLVQSLVSVALFVALYGFFLTPWGRAVRDVATGVTFVVVTLGWFVLATIVSLFLYLGGRLVGADRKKWGDALGRFICWLPGVLDDLFFGGRQSAGGP